MIHRIVQEVWYMQPSDVWMYLKNGMDENERPRHIVFILFSWNFVNETRVTEKIATHIIALRGCVISFADNPCKNSSSKFMT